MTVNSVLGKHQWALKVAGDYSTPMKDQFIESCREETRMPSQIKSNVAKCSTNIYWHTLVAIERIAENWTPTTFILGIVDFLIVRIRLTQQEI